MPHRRLFKKTDTWEYGFDSRAHEQPLEAPKKRRALTTVLFAASFFAGAAFTAFAGDQLAAINTSGVDSTAGAVASSGATAGNAAASDPTMTPDSASSADPTAAPTATPDGSTASAAADASSAATDPKISAKPSTTFKPPWP